MCFKVRIRQYAHTVRWIEALCASFGSMGLPTFVAGVAKNINASEREKIIYSKAMYSNNTLDNVSRRSSCRNCLILKLITGCISPQHQL